MVARRNVIPHRAEGGPGPVSHLGFQNIRRKVRSAPANAHDNPRTGLPVVPRWRPLIHSAFQPALRVPEYANGPVWRLFCLRRSRIRADICSAGPYPSPLLVTGRHEGSLRALGGDTWCAALGGAGCRVRRANLAGGLRALGGAANHVPIFRSVCLLPLALVARQRCPGVRR